MANGYVLESGRILAESACADRGIATSGIVKESIHPHSCILTSGIVSESKRADSGIEATVRVDIQGECSVGRVFGAGGVAKERLIPNRSVDRPAVVVEKRVGSNRRIRFAAGVEQKRCGPHCGIGIRVVENQRSNANTGIKAAAAI